jgi:hypothetical protein
MPEWSDGIYAIGVISLNYCQLENMFLGLFQSATGMTEVQVVALFQRLQNDSRLKIFSQLTNQRSEFPADFKDRIRHFAAGYEVCVENRNAIMHSHSRGSFFSERECTEGILLAKAAKSGSILACPLDLTGLRRIADDIHRYIIYAAGLTADLDASLELYRRNDPRAWQLSRLSDKPLLPQNLAWRPISEFQGAIPRSGPCSAS